MGFRHKSYINSTLAKKTFQLVKQDPALPKEPCLQFLGT